MPKRTTGDRPELKPVNVGAAAIDIGSKMHMAAVNPACTDMPVRTFGTFTEDLHHLADWFKACGVTSVAMESTGVYWIPVYEILEQRGFEVILVNARYAKNVPRRSLLREGSDMKFAFVAKHRTIWPVAWLCDALGVSRSGFHAWLNRSPSARFRSDEELGGRVKASFAASDRTYGARRVWRDLLADGADCGLHRIERLMRLQGLRARPRRRRLPKDSGDRQLETVPANLLDRQFAAERPNQKWIADFTYLWTAEGWLYVAAVIDLFSRRVVGWSMSAAMTAQLVTDALLMAVWRRGKPDALLHHSDQGSHYTSEQFQRLMADHGIVCSMSRSGNVWDNAAMESFFSSLKTERTANKIYRTRDEARADVFDYIERFYNTTRRHSTIGYLSPVEFERKVGLA